MSESENKPKEQWISYMEWDAMSNDERKKLIEEEIEKCENKDTTP